MRTIEVTREFWERVDELARIAKIPEIKIRLRRLADDYQMKLNEFEGVVSQSIVPEQDTATTPGDYLSSD